MTVNFFSLEAACLVVHVTCYVYIYAAKYTEKDHQEPRNSNSRTFKDQPCIQGLSRTWNYRKQLQDIQDAQEPWIYLSRGMKSWVVLGGLQTVAH